MEPPLVTVDGLWKKYPRSLAAARKYTLRDGFGLLVDRRRSDVLRDEEFWALRDVSLSLRRGECLGVIGSNGAGKTTLLRCLSGILKPDRGRIEARGRIYRLINLGGGFDPALSGRENIRLRAALLGISGRDFDRLFDEIVDFAELEEFIDSPIRFYSSGMLARLGFAVSTVSRPDVLLLDEVIAVGDLAFRLKCYDRIFDLISRSAVVFVSHSMAQIVRICTSACFLERGRIGYIGEVDRAIDAYHRSVGTGSTKRGNTRRNTELMPVLVRAGDERLAGETAELAYGTAVRVVIDTARLPAGALFRVILREAGDRLLMDWSSSRSPEGRADGGRIACDLGPLELRPGWYTLVVSALDPEGNKVIAHDEPFRFQVTGAFVNGVPVQKPDGWRRLGAGEP